MYKRSIITGLCSVSLLIGAPVHNARADHPLIIAGGAILAAEATIIAAELGAIALIVSSKISADAQIKSAKIAAEGKTETAGKGDQSKRSASPPPVQASAKAGGGKSFLPIGPLPKTLKEFILKYKGGLVLSSVGSGDDSSLLPTFDFSFEGDVMSAPDEVQRFTQDQRMTFDLVVEDKKAKGKTTIAVALKTLKLTTEDVPGSVGFSQLVIKSASGKFSNTWQARVDQGKTPKIDRYLGKNGSVKSSKDSLEVQIPIFIPIDVELGPDHNGKVRIEVLYKGSGQRT